MTPVSPDRHRGRTLDSVANPVGIEAMGAFLDTSEAHRRGAVWARERYAPLACSTAPTARHDLQVRNKRPRRRSGPARFRRHGRRCCERAEVLGSAAVDPSPVVDEWAPEMSLRRLCPASPTCRWRHTVPRTPSPVRRPRRRCRARGLAPGPGRDARGLAPWRERSRQETSFLRAGLIPYLEETAVGYRFLRDRGDQGAVLFVRSTGRSCTGRSPGLGDSWASRSATRRPRATRSSHLRGPLAEALGNRG